ncbi:hypothetical protein [Henriciella sp.]|uniref:hypothetical protein n=1 Tax=Henriciella sp. TaxID=1968823 RepID=UPI0026353B0A|nr:hypothetical protein [Henriciella sp.]
MSNLTGFLTEGFNAVRDALDTAAARANLHLRPETISRAVARRVRATLKRIEAILRQLLVLLAAEIGPLPAAATAPQAPARTPRTPAPGTRRTSFVLMPVYRYDGAALQVLQARASKMYRAHTVTTPLLDRLHTLRTLLDNPWPAARRMARLISRLKREGAPEPIIGAQDRLHRYGTAFGMFAHALPERVKTAFRAWPDTS